jgi:hypothetical protein
MRGERDKVQGGRIGKRDYFSGRFSRQSMHARTPKITTAIALGHKGMLMPLTITVAQAKMRRRCASAISEKITIAVVVKNFMRNIPIPIRSTL